MKLRIVPIFTMLVLFLLLAACRPALGPVGPGGLGPGTLVRVSCDDFGSQPHRSEQINVTAGNRFTVVLCSNATTGFQWSESAQISDQAVVQQTGHEFVAPDAKGLVGVPGTEVWIFEALKNGTSTVTMEYSRPWEGGEKGEWTFNLTVIVE